MQRSVALSCMQARTSTTTGGAQPISKVWRKAAPAPQVYALAAAADERYRVLVLLAAFTSLRWGELAALRRSDIDAQARTVRVTRQPNEPGPRPCTCMAVPSGSRPSRTS